jgi:hypothetical protein
MLYNPHRNFDKGMDDAYMGVEPTSNGQSYMEGYEYSSRILDEMEHDQSQIQGQQQKECQQTEEE